jgi:hypothetical protein
MPSRDQFSRRSPTAQGDPPTATGDSPTAHGDSPTARRDSPTAQGDSPTAQGDSPTARGDSPTARADSPTARADSPPAHRHPPTAQGDKRRKAARRYGSGVDNPQYGDYLARVVRPDANRDFIHRLEGDLDGIHDNPAAIRRDRAAAWVASQQLSLITARQLHEAAFGRHAIMRRRQKGVLQPVHHGVYCSARRRCCGVRVSSPLSSHAAIPRS